MFGYMFKNVPAQFIFAGYNVKKGLTVMTTDTLDGVVYDIFIYTYIDNHLSFFIQMEDGSYKSVDLKINVPELKNNEIASRHMFRGAYYDTSEYDTYDKDKVIGVFGLRGLSELMKQVDDMEKDLNMNEMSLRAMLDEKAAYSGLEIVGAINRFNRDIRRIKGYTEIPSLKKDEKDTFESVIGDEAAWEELCKDKGPDQIVDEIIKLDKESRATSSESTDLNDMILGK